MPKEVLSSEKRSNEVLSLPFAPIILIELWVIMNQACIFRPSCAELLSDCGSWACNCA